MTCICKDEPKWETVSVPHPIYPEYRVYKCLGCGNYSELHWSETFAVDEGGVVN